MFPLVVAEGAPGAGAEPEAPGPPFVQGLVGLFALPLLSAPTAGTDEPVVPGANVGGVKATSEPPSPPLDDVALSRHVCEPPLPPVLTSPGDFPPGAFPDQL